MAYDAKILRVIVASPGDVPAERDIVAKVLEELNKGTAADRGLRMEAVRWETDTYPGFNPEGPQGLIDGLLEIQASDVVVGIFWKRFGTPVADAESGTEHELQNAFVAWRDKGQPQLMVYFNQKAYAPRSKDETDQWGKVLDFQKSFPKEGLWWPYKGTPNFEQLLRKHLTNYLRAKFPLSQAAPPAQDAPVIPLPSPSAQAVVPEPPAPAPPPKGPSGGNPPAPEPKPEPKPEPPAPEPTALANPPVALATPAPAVDLSAIADNMNQLIQAAVMNMQLQNAEAVQEAAGRAEALYAQAESTGPSTDLLIIKVLKQMVCLFLPLTKVLVFQIEGRFSKALEKVDEALQVSDEAIRTIQDYAGKPDHVPEAVEVIQPLLALFPILLRGQEAYIRADVVGYQGRVSEYLELLKQAVQQFRKASELPPSDNPLFLALKGTCLSYAERLETRAEFFELREQTSPATRSKKKP